MSESTAKDVMSSPAKTVLSTATIREAQRALVQCGSDALGLCVVDDAGKLIGLVSRKDLDVSLCHGLGSMPVIGCVGTQLRTVHLETSIETVQSIVATFNVDQVPVLSASGELAGIVNRTALPKRLGDPALSQVSPLPSEPPLPSADYLYQQLALRVTTIWPALMMLAATAEEQGWSLYLVGGAVRDLLLSLSGQPHPLTDIDLVVEGATDDGAGVLLAEAIQARYPQVDLQTYGQFQTAALTWLVTGDGHSTGSSCGDAQRPWLIDIATARTEVYPYPAANPEVASSTIQKDLYRRDFTINAIALCLTGSQPGQLLDLFGGWSDLRCNYVRVLHPNSFIEDPTRIFRAVRFATRLGFELETHTLRLIRCAIASGLYAQMQTSKKKIPALQSRLQSEVRYLLEGDWWEAALGQIADLGALGCIHRDLSMTPLLWQQLRRMHRWLDKLAPKQLIQQPRWLMLLLLLLAQLEALDGYETAKRLRLDQKNQQQIKRLHAEEGRLRTKFSQDVRHSQVYESLRSYSQVELLLMAARHPYTLGPQIWHYIVHLSRMPPLINGGTLERLGLSPGPQFREILTSVHHLTLDGVLTSHELAKNYVLENYPKR